MSEWSKEKQNLGEWVTFYRKNLHRFAKDYLNITLDSYQAIELYLMGNYNHGILLANRGAGKTWLTAVYVVCIAILYPHITIAIASSSRNQGNLIMEKIKDELMVKHDRGSKNLCYEIFGNIVITKHDAHVRFKNNAKIMVVMASDLARGERAQILIIDEFRLIPNSIYNSVLRRFLAGQRHRGYLSNPQYKHIEERNKEIFLSSCWYQAHESYKKTQAYFANMLEGRFKYFVLNIPYQICTWENRLSKEQIEEEMSEEDFDEVKFYMEMQSLFYGDTKDAFFKFSDIDNRRKSKNVFYPLGLYKSLDYIPVLEKDERRILSVDVALLSSKKRDNDAAALTINRSICNGENPFSNIVLIDTHEGFTTDELGLLVMRYFYKYKCTDLVIDVAGQGIGVFDFIIKEQHDPEYGETYTALSCYDRNHDLNERCKATTSNPVIHPINASPALNDEACHLLRNAFMNNRITLPISEFEAESILEQNIKGYNDLKIEEQTRYLYPYVQASMLVNEITKLEYDIVGNKVRIKERSGHRKDRYCSVAYGYLVSVRINIQTAKRKNESTMSYFNVNQRRHHTIKI